jgi:hypothetical protein
MTNFTFNSGDEPVSSTNSAYFNESDDANVLNSLKKIISEKVKRTDIYIPVPERSGVMIRVSPNITQQQMKNWRKSAGEDRKNGMDTIRFSAHLIAATTTGILLNDEIVTDASGIEVTFASPQILEMTGTSRPHPDCVLAFFGLEPHVESAAVAIIESAGYGDNLDAVDPTKRSSES